MFSNRDDERQYRIFIQVSNTGAWEYYLADGSPWYSAEYFLMLGRDVKDFVPFSPSSLQTCWSDFMHPEDHDKAMDIFWSFLSNEKATVYESHFRLKHADGTWVWILSRGMKASSVEHEPYDKIIGTHINITDFKEEEIQRRRYEKQLMQSQKMELLGALASGIAHDFKNIITGILNYTQLGLKHSDESSSSDKYFRQIRKAGIRGDELAKQILSYSRDDQPGFQIQDPFVIIEEVAAFLQPVLPRNVNLEVIKRNSGPVLCNPSQMYQLIMNLCSNAIHAIDEDSGKISIVSDTLSVREKAIVEGKDLEKGEYFVLQVCDTGCGIPEESVATVFQPFYSTKGKHLGTGLGLSIVSNITKKHKALITIHSEIGKGTEFKVYFPLKK